ncbi:MAG: hypothetical protein R3B70_13620 [Polyangiaceae bacterium]
MARDAMVWGARRTRGVWMVAVILAVVGCQSDPEKFPPPIDAPGGFGGSIGGTTSTTSTTPVDPANACECVYEYTTEEACGTCVNDNLAVGGPCDGERATCELSSECVDLANDCPKACLASVKPEELAACIRACIVPIQDTEGYKRFFALMECVCGKTCVSECAPGEKIACE